MQRYQNTITTNYKLEKIQRNKIQMRQNANVTKKCKKGPKCGQIINKKIGLYFQNQS